jgi:1-acyl-sn-glycerol-3-phosphate acyltransferase
MMPRRGVPRYRRPMNLGRLVSLPLDISGWQYEGDIPPEKKYVCLAFPHTSNWDGLLLVAITQRIGLELSWMIKAEWVRGPMGVLLRSVGAVPIDRSGAHNVVTEMVEQFKSRDRMVLGIPPEGTRRRADYWKSGFYHIALGAGVPVVPGYLDYRRKRAGLGPAIPMTGDVRADMDKIRAFYERIHAEGRVPANVGPIRLRDEDAKT